MAQQDQTRAMQTTYNRYETNLHNTYYTRNNDYLNVMAFKLELNMHYHPHSIKLFIGRVKHKQSRLFLYMASNEISRKLLPME